MASSGGSGVDKENLTLINENKDGDAIQKLGGVQGVAKLLGSDPKHGLDQAAVEKSKADYGENAYKQAPPAKFYILCWEAMHDPIIILLIVAALVSTVLGAAIPDERAHNGWIEGVAIWFAVAVVVFVGAGNDWQKDRQFRKLNAVKDTIDIKVVRGGHQTLVKNGEVVVGDIMLLDTGDKVIADGIIIESFGLVIDEASLTGEADPIKKSTEDPWVRSGTQVSEGSGRMLVVAVGENSEWGKTMALMQDAGDDETPLQQKLEIVAGAVGKVGAVTAVACFIALLIKWCVTNNGFPIKKINDNGPVQFFLYAVTIVVVAVPEGLPLAVTISLAYSMKKMMTDNNFVRVLSACETMGGATAICSDKTGTLTENRMTVVEGWMAGSQLPRAPKPTDLPPALSKDLINNMALNSKAFLLEEAGGKLGFVGNRTECALLLLLRDWGIDYAALREQTSSCLLKLYGFSSAKKMSSCVIRETRNGREVLMVYNKGAAEWVLRRCTSYVSDSAGTVSPMTDSVRQDLINKVTAMASRGLRCICASQCEIAANDSSRTAEFFDDSDNVDCNLTAVALFGIKDPVRKEVPDAVATCKRAGITVRMVTGDNIHTARHIARECGILDDAQGHICMEGPDFRATPEEDMIKRLPMLRVLARSSPEDKLKLVRLIKSLGEVVAVTGDGTNDAPALKESDVGLAMGIAGTEVAKEAADIIIMDDNFSSIVKSVLWGRTVFANIRKFLMFQLTVNFVALVTAFVGAVVSGKEPLNVLQLLWVNLIMDSLGALALATEAPSPEVLKQKPYKRTDFLITRIMWTHIIVQGCYQLFWMFVCLWALPAMFSRYEITSAEIYYASTVEVENNGVKATVSECINKLSGEAYGSQAARYCNWMNNCGLPYHSELRNTGPSLDFTMPGCELYTSYWKSTGGPVPEDEVYAICHVKSPPTCQDYSDFESAKVVMEKAYKAHAAEDASKSLSVLFNAFIMMQVFNEINARRINDEYTIFVGLFSSTLFMAVLIITVGLQAIIMNFLGIFFKVVPLNWVEWLATIAIGAGSTPLSLITRFISRTFFHSRAAIEAAEAEDDDPDHSENPKHTHTAHPELTKGHGSMKGGGGGSMKGLPKSSSGRHSVSRTELLMHGMGSSSSKIHPGTDQPGHGPGSRTTSGKPKGTGSTAASPRSSAAVYSHPVGEAHKGGWPTSESAQPQPHPQPHTYTTEPRMLTPTGKGQQQLTQGPQVSSATGGENAVAPFNDRTSPAPVGGTSDPAAPPRESASLLVEEAEVEQQQQQP